MAEIINIGKDRPAKVAIMHPSQSYFINRFLEDRRMLGSSRIGPEAEVLISKYESGLHINSELERHDFKTGPFCDIAILGVQNWSIESHILSEEVSDAVAELVAAKLNDWGKITEFNRSNTSWYPHYVKELEIQTAGLRRFVDNLNARQASSGFKAPQIITFSYTENLIPGSLHCNPDNMLRGIVPLVDTAVELLNKE